MIRKIYFIKSKHFGVHVVTIVSKISGRNSGRNGVTSPMLHTGADMVRMVQSTKSN